MQSKTTQHIEREREEDPIICINYNHFKMSIYAIVFILCTIHIIMREKLSIYSQKKQKSNAFKLKLAVIVYHSGGKKNQAMTVIIIAGWLSNGCSKLTYNSKEITRAFFDK